MALSKSALTLFAAEVAPRLHGGEVLALGVPEIGATREELEALFGGSLPDNSYGALMKLLGFHTWNTLDVSNYEGCDYVADLNQPVIGLPRFDLVIDNGTIEHCFDVAQALFNAKALCKLGGHVFHNNPANWFGHGFWSMSPCVYFDFYEANGFEVDVFLRDVAKQTWQRLEYQPRLTRILEGRQVIHAIARRVSEQPDYLPTQRWCMTQHSGYVAGSKIPPATEGRTHYRSNGTREDALPKGGPPATDAEQTRHRSTHAMLAAVGDSMNQPLQALRSEMRSLVNTSSASLAARKLREFSRDPRAFFRDSRLVARTEPKSVSLAAEPLEERLDALLGAAYGSEFAKICELLARRRLVLFRDKFSRHYLSSLGLAPNTVVDVGVNYGTEDLYAAFPDARFLLIDPHEVNFQACMQRFPHLTYDFMPCAAGSQPGKVSFSVARVSGHSSIVHRVDPPKGHTKELKEVDVVRLDDTLIGGGYQPRYGIKIDTEGFELEVLRGTERILADVEFIIAELQVKRIFRDSYRFSEVVQFLGERGFELFDVLNARGSSPNHLDCLFLPYGHPRLRFEAG